MSTLKLRNLTASSNKMLSSLIQLPVSNSMEKLKDEVEKLRRRCHIMSLLYDRYIVSVAGLQGVGKSTMISNLYGYNSENTPFLENQGQGETLPILVTESDTPGRYFVHRAIEGNGVISIQKVELDNRTDFHNISHEYRKNDLLLEITVPFKVFNRTDKGFLLLPGFQSDTDYLKELTYSALRASSNCLVLFYQTKYAHKNNKDLIDTLNEEFRDAAPLFLITWSDSEESNIDLMNRVRNDLGNVEEDRVIRTGVPGPKTWKEDVIKSINKYSLPMASLLEVQEKNIKNLIGNYNKLVSSLKVHLRKLNIDKDNREYDQVDVIIKEFRIASNSIKERLKFEIKNTFQSYFKRVQDSISKSIVNRYKGWDGFGRNVSEFFTNDVEVREEFKNLVTDCIKNSNLNDIRGEYQIILNKVVNEFWNKYGIVMKLPEQENVHYEKKSLLCGDNGESKSINEEAINDIYAIVNPDKKDLKFSKNLKFNIRLLPLLALESFRVNNIIANASPPSSPFGTIDEQKSILNFYQENKREVAIGLGVIFGMDIIEGDGIDLFGLLHHNAKSGGAAMASASINWVLASIAAGGMVIYMLDQLNKSVSKKDSAARFVVEKMNDYTIEVFLAEYDLAMQRYEDILRDYLVRRYDLAHEYANIQNCYSSILALENINREIELDIRVEQ